jgi:hypothetical protein
LIVPDTLAVVDEPPEVELPEPLEPLVLELVLVLWLLEPHAATPNAAVIASATALKRLDLNEISLIRLPQSLRTWVPAGVTQL